MYAGEAPADICGPAAISALTQGYKLFLSVGRSKVGESLLAALVAAPRNSANCVAAVGLLAITAIDHGLEESLQQRMLLKIYQHMLIDRVTMRAPSAHIGHPMRLENARSILQPVLPWSAARQGGAWGATVEL